VALRFASKFSHSSAKFPSNYPKKQPKRPVLEQLGQVVNHNRINNGHTITCPLHAHVSLPKMKDQKVSICTSQQRNFEGRLYNSSGQPKIRRISHILASNTGRNGERRVLGKMLLRKTIFPSPRSVEHDYNQMK
jgi:hypothetical protein